MSILVSGSKEFDDYNVFLRAIGVAIDDIVSSNDDVKTIDVYSAGPVKINGFTAEFCNVTEETFRRYGFRVRFHKFPYRTCVSSMSSWGVKKVLLFGVRDHFTDPIAVTASLSGIEVRKY